MNERELSEHHIEVRRTARYYTLGGTGGSEAVSELWIVCHGYGQLAASFTDSFRTIAAPSRMIVAPEALSRFYLDRSPPAQGAPPPRVGASWMTREDREREIADQVAYLDTLHDHVRAPLDGARVRLHVLGFSQGVATIGRWLARGRARADGMVLWCGSYPPDVELTAIAPRLAATEVVLVAGTLDALTPMAAAEAQLARFRDAGIRSRLVSFEGGHRMDDSTLAEIAAAHARA